MQRLGRKYWNMLPWDGPLGRDDDFMLTGEGVEQEAAASLDPINDIAVLVFFSVFETIVRNHVEASSKLAMPGVQSPILRAAISSFFRSIDKRPINQILELYKSDDANLVMEVKQVQEYRNWVAHGKRGTPVVQLTPKAAYDRLARFLERYGPQPLSVDPDPDAPPADSDDSLSQPL
jgi:hypothetical protein